MLIYVIFYIGVVKYVGLNSKMIERLTNFYRRKALNEYITTGITSVIISFLDCFMYYYLCNNLIEKKSRLSVKTILIGILYGVVLGTLSNVVDGNAVRVIMTTIMFFILKFITGKKIQDLSIIFAIIYLCTALIQVLCLQAVSILGLEINESYTFLLVQMLTAFITFLIYVKIPLYKLYNKIEKEILFKLLIFILAGVLLLTLFYYNFEYTASYVLYFSLLVIITFFGLFQTLKRILFYTNKVPMQLHDMKNLLMSIRLSAYSTSDINVIRGELDEVLEIIDIDSNKENIKVADYNQNILSFINQKKRNAVYDELPFLTDIGYYEPNSKVSFFVVLYMLGVLLDNAIESGTKKAIIIKVFVIKDSLYLSVSNEYKRKSADDFNKMFQERYSTKGEGNSRGYGLPNLSKVVNTYNGEILLKEEYLKEQKSDYLTISIEIKS